jgi:hypothetical protein
MKNLTKLSVLVFLALVIVLGGCKKDSSKDNTTPTTPYFTFAKVGNVANFTTSASTPLGVKTGTMTQTVLEKIGDNIYKVKTEMDFGLGTLMPPTTDTSFWYIGTSELADVDDSNGTNKFMYYAAGDAINKTYTFSDGTSTTTRTILSTSESVTSALGSFSTYKIRETNDASTNETVFYFNNNVGMVKSTIVYGISVGGFPVNINMDIVLNSKNF